jgi:glyoxylase-like metal-dependent hydrolase (beta-lactamase superfamily II)
MNHSWSWQLLRAGSFRLDGGSMFGIVPKPLWAKLTTPDDRNRIDLQTNCLLLDDGSHKVLIETGYGGKWNQKDRDIFHLQDRTILDALREVDAAPETIDHIIVTHLHFDHAGGLTHLNPAGEANRSFPGAAIFVQKTEWNDALANKTTMKKTYLRDHLDPVADQVRLIEGETEILPGLHAWPMIGHTWGHQAVRFRDAEGIVCFPGDVMPTINHAGSAFNMGYDMLPYENMLSKRALLERAAEEKWRLVIGHETGDPVVRVVPDADRPGEFRLQPA